VSFREKYPASGILAAGCSSLESILTVSVLTTEKLEALRQFDTCTIANAIERFEVRLRNQGFTQPGLQCVTGGFPRVLGYAATRRVRSSDPPMAGVSYLDRTDWWGDIGCLPTPRIAVVQDLAAGPGSGSCVGQVHAAILKAFHCQAVITNGLVRDLPGVSGMQFPMFARGVAVSHSYAHLVDYGTPVEIFGLEIRPGYLLYADCHGVISIPLEVAAELPEVAGEIRASEARIIDVCLSPDFSPERLLNVIQDAH
jgi:4-hydroxy-4-methyl-2-oxoglutarate aldolase